MNYDRSDEFWPSPGLYWLCGLLGAFDVAVLLQFIFRVLPRFFH